MSKIMSKLLGVDYGTEQVGIAISDDEKKQAFVYATIPAESVLEELEDIIEKEDVETIVLGLPLSLSGAIGPQAEKVQEFGYSLEDALPVLVEYEDERFTTKVSADLASAMGPDVDDHQLAAQEILQTYIDRTINV